MAGPHTIYREFVDVEEAASFTVPPLRRRRRAHGTTRTDYAVSSACQGRVKCTTVAAYDYSTDVIIRPVHRGRTMARYKVSNVVEYRTMTRAFRDRRDQEQAVMLAALMYARDGEL
jgi:hypothetical protein